MANERKVAVIGAGTMGSGIAQVAVQAGFDAVVCDIAEELVQKGLGRIRGFVQRSKEKGNISDDDERRIVSRLQGTTDMTDCKDACLVIEAATENLDVKRDLFEKLDALCAGETLLATNTSSLSVTAIAGATQHPDRVLGMHFFNPPPLMALVEVVQGEQTSTEAVDKAVGIAKKLGKSPVRTKDTPGFIVNRIARPFYNEALRILGDGGVQVETIDRVMKSTGGFRMGPFELMDLIGIDINFTATESLYNAFFQDPRLRPSPIQQRLYLAGHLGRKTGRGFYSYESK